LSFLGFLGMLGATFVIERNARKLGRAGWQQMTDTFRTGRLKDSLGGTSGRVRNRFRRDQQ
jgi:hypothetical protein